MGGCTFERKAPFATSSFKKGGWAYFRRWTYFREITVLSNKHSSHIYSRKSLIRTSVIRMPHIMIFIEILLCIKWKVLCFCIQIAAKLSCKWPYRKYILNDSIRILGCLTYLMQCWCNRLLWGISMSSPWYSQLLSSDTNEWMNEWMNF